LHHEAVSGAVLRQPDSFWLHGSFYVEANGCFTKLFKEWFYPSRSFGDENLLKKMKQVLSQPEEFSRLPFWKQPLKLPNDLEKPYPGVDSTSTFEADEVIYGMTIVIGDKIQFAPTALGRQSSTYGALS